MTVVRLLSFFRVVLENSPHSRFGQIVEGGIEGFIGILIVNTTLQNLRLKGDCLSRVQCSTTALTGHFSVREVSNWCFILGGDKETFTSDPTAHSHARW
jgi:hypothetical protein